MLVLKHTHKAHTKHAQSMHAKRTRNAHTQGARNAHTQGTHKAHTQSTHKAHINKSTHKACTMPTMYTYKASGLIIPTYWPWVPIEMLMVLKVHQ